jgi:hypothetical protein
MTLGGQWPPDEWFEQKQKGALQIMAILSTWTDRPSPEQE